VACRCLGLREEALASSQEAVDIRRRIAETRPDAFLPNLATSLNNLGIDLSASDAARRRWPQARRPSISEGASQKPDPTLSSPISREASEHWARCLRDWNGTRTRRP
jgi:hypothetical protein